MQKFPKIILGIPGCWETREEFKHALIKNGYMCIGNLISRLEKTEAFFEVEMEGYNPFVVEAFETARNGSFSGEELNNLKKFKSIVYIIGEGGSVEKVLSIMEVASAILRAGGLAVNVESSGRARTKQDWLQITNEKNIVGMFTAFIQMAYENDLFYTAGMKCFGYPDVTCAVESMTGAEITELFSEFCLYNLIENPEINDGETFSLAADAPVFLMKREKCQLFEENHLFYNPYGVWNLVSLANIV